MMRMQARAVLLIVAVVLGALFVLHDLAWPAPPWKKVTSTTTQVAMGGGQTTTSTTTSSSTSTTGAGGAAWKVEAQRIVADRATAQPALEQWKGTRRHADLQDEGTLTLGRPCEPLERLRDYRKDALVCAGNGDLVASPTDCRTGALRPPSLPHDARPGRSLPGRAFVYPEWAAQANPGWYYTTDTACELAAKLGGWCSGEGCVMTSGTCRLTGHGMTQLVVADGTCQFRPVYADVSHSTPGTVLNRTWPKGGNETTFGDNVQGHPWVAGRGDYGGPDEIPFAAGLWGDARSGDIGTIVRGGVGAGGFGIINGASIGIATSPPPVLTPIAGGFDGSLGSGRCVGITWEVGNGGSTRVGPVRCLSRIQGGVRVSQPPRDGWTWPAGGAGRTLGRVFIGWVPDDCEPLPSNPAQCEPRDPRRVSLYFVDYLLSPDDWLAITNPNVEEFESVTDVNTTGGATFAGYDPTLGFGTCRVGDTMSVGQPCGTEPSNGWWYSLYGFNCPAQPFQGQRCSRKRGVPVTIPVLPAKWSGRRMPFCAGGLCWQRLGPRDVGTVFAASGYPNSCVFRVLVPSRDDADPQWTMGYCNDAQPNGLPGPYRLEFYGPGGVTDVQQTVP